MILQRDLNTCLVRCRRSSDTDSSSNTVE